MEADLVGFEYDATIEDGCKRGFAMLYFLIPKLN